MSIGIYKIENLINKKIYVGQSIDIEERWKKHISANDNFVIHKALHKYGKENFSFQIIEECPLEKLDERERYWINFYNSLLPNGYNMIPGGSNGMGFSKGRPVLQYDMQGIFVQEYSSANQASLATGIDHWSICACCRSEYKHAGNFQWKYMDSDKIISVNTKRTDFTVLQIDKDTDEIINEFNSIASAEKITGVSKATICKVCNGKGKTAGGFKWKYKK